MLLLLLLELGTRGALSVHRWLVAPVGPPVASGVIDNGESFHLFFQNVLPPGPGIAPGPRFAGFVVEEPVGGRDAATFATLFLGGSTSANDFPSRVRARLDSADDPVALYNLAAPWHSSLHSLHKLWTYVDEARPDAVVLLHGVNDFYRGFTPPGLALPEYRDDYSHHPGPLRESVLMTESVYDGRPALRLRGPKRARDDSIRGLALDVATSSALVHEVTERLARRDRRDVADPSQLSRVSTGDEMLTRSLPAFRRNLRNIAIGCRSKGAALVLVTMPFTTECARREFLPPSAAPSLFTNDGRSAVTDADFRRGMGLFNAVVREVSAEHDATLVDAATAITDPGLFSDEVHLTDAGREKLALSVSDALEDIRSAR